jgi:hypothetical protein
VTVEVVDPDDWASGRPLDKALLDGRIDRGQGGLGTTALIEFRPAA